MKPPRWSREEYERYKARQTPVVGNIAFSPANMEPGIGNESLAEKKTKGHDGQFNLVFISRRRRLADSDGLCGKYLLDSLVSSQILKDDSPDIVKSVTHEQVKIGKGEAEKTIVEIRSAEG